MVLCDEIFHWCSTTVTRVGRRLHLNTLRLRQDGHHFADDIFNCVVLNEKVFRLIKISLKIVFMRIQLMINQHWFRWWLDTEEVTSHYLNQRWPGLQIHMCITQPWWVKHPILYPQWENGICYSRILLYLMTLIQCLQTYVINLVFEHLLDSTESSVRKTHFAGLGVNYGISNTAVLEIP